MNDTPMKAARILRRLPRPLIAAGLLALTAVVSNAAEGGIAPSAAPSAANAKAAPTVQAEVWNGFNRRLPKVVFDEIPLPEVADFLRASFTNESDILLPRVLTIGAGLADPATGQPGQRQVNDVFIKLQLLNVTATEIFNGMNLWFEIEQVPLRWELVANNSRPTAVLRSVAPPALARPQPAPERGVFFVGDQLGATAEERRRGWELISDTLQKVCADTLKDRPRISMHPDAELLVVVGSREELAVVRETLAALKEKARHDAARAGQPTGH